MLCEFAITRLKMMGASKPARLSTAARAAMVLPCSLSLTYFEMAARNTGTGSPAIGPIAWVHKTEGIETG